MLLACVMKTAASTIITSSRATKPSSWRSCRRRLLSSAQVSTALRPFYFLIHPDLFGKWPQEQAVNEASLKQLKSYLNIMLDEKRRPQPLTVTFYVKPRLSSRKNLRKIQLNLASEAKIRKSIVAILSTVELPTSYVDSIPDVESDLVTAGQQSSHFESTIFGFEDNELDFQSKIELMHPTDTRRPLPMWLRHNVEVAQTRMAKSEPMRLQTERLQDELCRELNLKDIQWDCGWDTTHKIGVLAAFNNLLRQHEDIKHILNDRTLVFGQDSGMSLEGQIILYTGEVRSNWLNVIRNIPNFQASLQHIPLVEKALSQNLRGIKIRRRPNQPLKLVENYKQQLMQLVTNVSDYLSRNKFPEKWPKSLEDYEICVDNESCPLTLSPRGQFIVPSSCPGFLLVPFMNENMEEAKMKMSLVEQDHWKEMNLVIKCINELGLIQLDRDESLDPKNMVDCCSRLLENASMLRHLTHGNHILVTRYYSVNADGVICIPWNWKLAFGETL